MPVVPTTLDSIATSLAELSDFVTRAIPDLTDTMEERFDRLEQRMTNMEAGQVEVKDRLDRVEQRMTDVETGQRGIRDRLEAVEGETQALHNDVLELYHMAV